MCNRLVVCIPHTQNKVISIYSKKKKTNNRLSFIIKIKKNLELLASAQDTFTHKHTKFIKIKKRTFTTPLGEFRTERAEAREL